MGRAFAQITFTASVKAAQARYGSYAGNAGFERAEDPLNVLTSREAEFIAERDSFYQASVSETGWPYVQFRGGPKGFLKVLDERTIGYADFRGNVQYISTGNINADGRVALILMDYPNRRRLKLWARARIVHEDEDPVLLARLEVPTYRASVERAVVMTIEAFDWNCPQHITPRFTEDEISEIVAPTRGRFAPGTAENEAIRATAAPSACALGSGPLELVVAGIRQLTPRIRAYELQAPDGGILPAWTAGAHLSVPVRFPDGRQQTRSYSLMGAPADRHAYEIAVLRDDSGQGGSVAVHQHYGIGTVLRCAPPRNLFEMHDDGRPSVLIAGGIGITPIRAMALALLASGHPFELHYTARTPAEMVLRKDFETRLDSRLRTYFSKDAASAPMDVGAILAGAPPDAVFYVCGPATLIAAVHEQAMAAGIPSDRVKSERFTAKTIKGARPVTVHLARTGKTLTVVPEQTILDALIAAGVEPLYDCRAGLCGVCATKVLDGLPDHRDSALSEAERTRAGLMCTCVSRGLTDHLTLDC